MSKHWELMALLSVCSLHQSLRKLRTFSERTPLCDLALRICFCLQAYFFMLKVYGFLSDEQLPFS